MSKTENGNERGYQPGFTATICRQTPETLLFGTGWNGSISRSKVSVSVIRRRPIFGTISSTQALVNCQRHHSHFRNFRTFSVFSSSAGFGTRVAQTVFQERRKEVNQMKTAKAFFAALLLLGNLTASGMALAADGIIEKEQAAPGSYCHEKFQAIQPSTLGSDHPTVQSSTSGDVIDFYGPCDETPTGKDQVWEQKLDRLFLQNAQ